MRNALNWSKQINVALYKFGQDAEVMFASHSWPRWGNARIQEVMRTQRDTYANLNNQTLHYANLGVTINEIQNVYQLPPSLWKQWPAHSYHGSEMHNSRGVINRFLGYWDGNPVNIAPLSPRDSAPLYVEMMGGSDKILAKGKELNGQGKYRESMEILNKLVFAQPGNQPAKDLLADAFEQLGYQMESPTLRNIYLQGAYELRNGLPTGTGRTVDRTGHDPRHVDRELARLHRHQHRPAQGRGPAFHHQSGHARQWRDIRHRDEQCDAHQHQGRAGEKPGSHHHGQSRRPQPGDDGRQPPSTICSKTARRSSKATASHSTSFGASSSSSPRISRSCRERRHWMQAPRRPARSNEPARHDAARLGG